MADRPRSCSPQCRYSHSDSAMRHLLLFTVIFNGVLMAEHYFFKHLLIFSRIQLWQICAIYAGSGIFVGLIYLLALVFTRRLPLHNHISPYRHLFAAYTSSAFFVFVAFMNQNLWLDYLLDETETAHKPVMERVTVIYLMITQLSIAATLVVIWLRQKMNRQNIRRN